MVSINVLAPLQRFLRRPNDDPGKTIFVAAAVSVVAALFVSSSVVLLRPIQEANRERERQAQIVKAVANAIGETGALQARIVDLRSGAFDPSVDPVTFDQDKAALDPQRSIAIPANADIARLDRRANHARVFVRESAGQIELLVMPVSGRGYASLIRAYLVLRGDLNTIAGLTVYEQAETPGLGARIADKAWQERWAGKKLIGSGGDIGVKVVQANASGPNEVDGITGATRTGQGITNAIRFWLGDLGFGPFLDRLRKERTP